MEPNKRACQTETPLQRYDRPISPKVPQKIYKLRVISEQLMSCHIDDESPTRYLTGKGILIVLTKTRERKIRHYRLFEQSLFSSQISSGRAKRKVGNQETERRK